MNSILTHDQQFARSLTLVSYFLDHPVPDAELPPYLYRAKFGLTQATPEQCASAAAAYQAAAAAYRAPDFFQRVDLPPYLAKHMREPSIQRTLDLLCHGAPVELRAKLPGKGMDIQRFADHRQAAEWALAFPKATAVYVVMNPYDEGRIKGDAVDDAAVTRRWWLLLDVDHDRAADTNATNEELQRCEEIKEAVKSYLTTCGWPEPVEADSGNGKHLLYRIDLPNDDESKRIVNGVLAYLNRTFSGDGTHIDTKVGNASRITKLYGTVTRKGPAAVERPHRMSCITRIPETLQPVAVADLKKIANLAPTKSATEALPQDVVAGSRNTLLFREGCRLRRLGLDEKAICAALTAINTERCRPALDAGEVQKIAHSCM